MMGPQPGHAIVLPAGGERGLVKSVDRRPIGGAEAEMRAGDRCLHLALAGDRSSCSSGRAGSTRHSPRAKASPHIRQPPS